MVRVIVGAVVGAIVLFLWGMISYMALPWHNMTMRPLPAEQAVVDALKQADLSTGAYYFPAMPNMNVDEAAWNAWNERHRAGPIGSVIYRAEGGDPMSPLMFAGGFGLNLLLAGTVATVLWLGRASLRSYGRRLAVCLLCGVAAVVVSDLQPLVWAFFPGDAVAVFAADHLLGFLFLGLALAAIVREAPPEAAGVTARLPRPQPVGSGAV